MRARSPFESRCRGILGLMVIALATDPSFAEPRALVAAPFVESQKDLLKAAIDAESGSIRREVSGPIAAMIRQAIQQPDARVFLTVETVHAFAQEGCKRLAFTYSTDKPVRGTDGREHPMAMTVTLNACRDGSPPRESVSPDAVASAFAGKRDSEWRPKDPYQGLQKAR